jgi:hydrogenase expression/formation protein HypD
MLTLDQARAVLGNDSGPRLTLMEICGTHTSVIAAHGLRSFLAPSIRLVSGPGCPVCVTPAGYIDQLCELALRPHHRVACFGDLIRVPGVRGSLAQAAAQGATVQMIYSPLDVLQICRSYPEDTIILAAVGFETTAPSYALLLARAREAHIGNLRLLSALRRMPPVLELLGQPEAAIDGFLAPGHVSAIIGSDAYLPLSAKSGKPFVVAGFTAEQVLLGLAELVKTCRSRQQSGTSAAAAAGSPAQAGPANNLGTACVINLYEAVVKPGGNLKAQAALRQVFVTVPAVWRGLGLVENSGYGLAAEYMAFEGGPVAEDPGLEPPGCRCGEILRGKIEPAECPLFGTVCRPESPVGPCMVSAEGVCGIHFHYSGLLASERAAASRRTGAKNNGPESGGAESGGAESVGGKGLC